MAENYTCFLPLLLILPCTVPGSKIDDIANTHTYTKQKQTL